MIDLRRFAGPRYQGRDPLTGLMNRGGFQDALRRELARSQRSGDPLTVLLADLDGFKAINDTFGHHQGDALLVEAADRLRRAARKADIVARLGGDEFAIALPATNVDRAEAIARRVEAALTAPIALDGAVAHLAASVGLAGFPDHAQTEAELLKRADAAMYAAKRGGLRRSVSALHTHSPPAADPVSLGDLARALRGEELVLLFQPKLELLGDRVVGVEALVRWQHPRLGLLAPAAFIALAERSGLIGDLTSWVLMRAIEQRQRWHADGLELSVSVNVSSHDLADLSFPERVQTELAKAEMPADRLIIELTETALLADLTTGARVLEAIRKLGVLISLSDFGSGYSALSYLSRLPIDEVKIDRSFFAAASEELDERTAAVVQSMIELAHRLGATVVAEGIEAPAISRQLTLFGCDQIQGYVHSPPLVAEAVAPFIREGWRSANVSRRPPS